MQKYEYKGVLYTINELSEMSGISPPAIRWRLRDGYSLEEALQIKATKDSVQGFIESSWWEDWIGMSTNDLHQIYWEWCTSNGYIPLQKNTFSRQLFQLYPNLKTVPTRTKNGAARIIRLRE